MSNLVGTGLNQVPTNGMLGGLAYQDPNHASIKDLDLKNLSQINSEIADTAVDVFVYDTRKDSDGGAWRKRTQNTSWYNETLGTSTRGTRKEFPAVAVIVAEATKVTIYDGDDPDLPMWMVFNVKTAVVGGTEFDMISGGTDTVAAESVFMLNGILSVALSASDGTSAGLPVINFISDSSINYRNLASSFTGAPYRGNISQRNDGLGNSPDTNARAIAAGSCNDVAMTVLPNAPVDSATGLPIPTIAVATDGGISVIKDDGTVVDITSASGGNYNQSKAITITEENYLWWLGDYNAGSTYLRDSYAVSLDNFPSSDFTWNNSTDNLSDGTSYALTTGSEAGEIKIGSANTWAWNHQERNALGGPAGLAIHKPNIGSETNSLIVAITSSYNTGWMHGNVEGAFLSDTDDTDKTNGQTDPDRSVNNNALTVNGTITKSAVATGAELVAYSGFSGSNYLQQPYNSSMDIFKDTSSTFSITGWIKRNSTNTGDVFFSTGRPGFTGEARSLALQNNGKLYFYGWNSSYDSGTTAVTAADSWTHFHFSYVNGLHTWYVNGVLDSTHNKPLVTYTENMPIKIGDVITTTGQASRPVNDSLSLLRISGSAPTAEQIKKMYEDERWLFQENAKATLYGSSDAVTALAYDDTTELLHVGTSAGRSEFQGLRRINNTTTAVTTAISASNDLVAEQ